MSGIPGWYGKLPFIGDFASRRLPSAFVSTWDDWLQSVVYGGRSLLGEQWLPVYLNSPVWHFSISPGLCGNPAWFGLLMSSVDRANRHFPFTLAYPVAAEALHDIAPGTVVDWLSTLESDIVAMLDVDGSVDSLEQRLLQRASPSMHDETQPSAAENLTAFVDRQAEIAYETVPNLLQAQLRASIQHGSPSSLWWTGPDDAGIALATACRGLPSAEAYCEMLRGE